MSLLDNIVKKAVKQKKHIKYPALMLSGVAEWVVGTKEEAKASKEILTDVGNDFVGPKDYTLHQSGTYAGMLAQTYGLWQAPHWTNHPALYILAADGMVRAVNVTINEIKRRRADPDGKGGPEDLTDLIGVIGTVRAIGYKIADRLKYAGDEPKLEAKIEDDIQ